MGILLAGLGGTFAHAQTFGATELQVNQPLRADSEVRSPNGQVRLVMQGDCNLVLYGPRGAVFWASRTDGRGANCFAIFQTDGNLVVHTGENVPVWASSTDNRGASQAVVSDDGTVSVRAGGRSLWSSPRPPGGAGPATGGGTAPVGGPERLELRMGQALRSDEGLRTGDGRLHLVMQSDCNLVLYRNGRTPLWATQTHGRGQNCRTEMQTDGNLVVYDQGNRALWASGTARSAADRLQLQSRGAIALLAGSGGRTVWSSDGQRSEPDGWRPPGDDGWNRPSRGGRSDNIGSNERLRAERDFLISDNGRFELAIRADCEVGLFEGQRLVWNLSTAGRGRNCELGLSRDGDLLLVDDRGRTVWNSRTSGSRADRLAVTDDGRVILLRRWTEVWASSRARY